MLKGIAVSKGYAIGKVYKYEEPEIKIVDRTDINKDEELKKFDEALNKTIADIEKVKERAGKNLSEAELAVFDAHLMMVQDPEYLDQIKNAINDGASAEKATNDVSSAMVSMFKSMDDDYFRERAADIQDVSHRLLCNVLGLVVPDLTAINEEVVIVANDLTPSDTAQLNKEFTLGFLTEIGGRTSHSAIMARSLEIPAVVGCPGVLKEIKAGDTIIMDAVTGDVIVNPNENFIKEYQEKKIAFDQEKAELKVLINEESISKDGHKVEVAGNIGGVKDAQAVVENGGEGVGLFRTEFLYMNSSNWPTEEEQYQAYKQVLETMGGKKVVVRTLDIGGDKKLDYYKFPEEMNPFLGYRAIRLCLDQQDIFKTQIRALLRASTYGKLCIMFPMIATVNEFKQAKAIVLEEKANLIKNGVKVADNIEIGMMVEIPSSAILAEQFAKYADFFSIGTNDLIQYSMAADRMSEKVSYLYQPLNPSVLRLIKLAIDGAHSQGKWCGMCGEVASDPMATPILLGLGLDEFSMSATSMLGARKIIRSLSYEEMKELANEAVALDTMEDVQALVNSKVSL